MCNKKIRIGIDVDNVILDFTEGFIKHFCLKTGIQLTREELDDWDFQNYLNRKYHFDTKDDIVKEILFEGNLIADLNYKHQSKEAILEMHENENIEIVFITALETELAPIRRKWFEENLKGINYELHFETIKSKIQVDYLIDDGVHNLDELSKYIPFTNCLCIKEPYNKDADYLKFDSLYEAYKYILKKENLI